MPKLLKLSNKREYGTQSSNVDGLLIWLKMLDVNILVVCRFTIIQFIRIESFVGKDIQNAILDIPGRPRDLQ